MLTVARINAAKSREKPYKLFDANGLYLIVQPTGAKYWRFRYRFEGREKTLSLGTYPNVRLAAARKNRDIHRRLLAEDGIDPGAKRKAEKAAETNSFKALAEEWIGKGCPGKGSKGPPKAVTVDILHARLAKHVYPWIGNVPIQSVTLDDMRRVLNRIERRGTIETANRVRALCDRIYRYAIATGRAERNLAADLRDSVASVATKSFAAITNARKFGSLLRAIDGYDGQPATKAALQLAPLFFVRPGELRAAEWDEFDLAGKRWSIPSERMKQGLPHVVPLANQAVNILNELEPLTGAGKYVFPSIRSADRPLSDNTLNAALRRLGFTKDEMTAHGFRTSASTLLHELGHSPDVIETQLAHKRPGVAGIYNKSHLLDQRSTMMQAWADYLDKLKLTRGDV